MRLNHAALYRFVLLAAVLLACSTARDGITARPYALGLGFEHLVAKADLEEAISEILLQNRHCSFSDDLRDRIGWPASQWADIERDPRAYCLTKIAATRVTQETDTLVSIEFEGRRVKAFRHKRIETYVVFASFVDRRWALTWPTPLGPELHPKRSP
jgi:hypothetical protein